MVFIIHIKLSLFLQIDMGEGWCEIFENLKGAMNKNKLRNTDLDIPKIILSFNN